MARGHQKADMVAHVTMNIKTFPCAATSAPLRMPQAFAGLKKERKAMNRAERRALGVLKEGADNG